MRQFGFIVYPHHFTAGSVYVTNVTVQVRQAYKIGCIINQGYQLALFLFIMYLGGYILRGTGKAYTMPLIKISLALAA